MSPHRRSPRAPRQHVAAATSAGAAVIHLAAAAPHAPEGLLLAGTFVVVGVLQLTVAALLAAGRGGSRVDMAAIGIHGVALAGWALSRTVGLPAFLHADVEPVGVADLVAAVFAVAAIVLVTWRWARPAPLSRSRPVSITALTLAWVLAISGSAAGLEALSRVGHAHGDHGQSAGHHHVPGAEH